MKNLLLLPILFLLVFAHGCTEDKSLKISGSTTVLPVVTKSAELFKLKTNTNVIINAGGSGVGLSQLGQGRVDIAMMSRAITSVEVKRYPKVNFVTHSIGRDAVVPVVSSELYDSGVRALGLSRIAQIYDGTVNNWKELGGPDREILAIDKERSRGTRHVFMEAVFGDKHALAPGADLVLGANNEEQTAITQSDSAIGLLSNAWINDDVKGLAIILDNGSIIEPTLENIINGTFPITRDLLLVTDGRAQGKVKEFIDFVLSKAGQDIVEDSGYVRIK